MGTVSEALQYVREVAPPDTQYFEPYRPAYEALLRELRALGGEAAMDELVSWVADRTREDEALPEPSSVRMHARTVCARRDIQIPDDSPLQEGSGAPGVNVTVTEAVDELSDDPDQEDWDNWTTVPLDDVQSSDDDHATPDDAQSSDDDHATPDDAQSSDDDHATPDDEAERQAAAVYEQLALFEPYTTDELVGSLGLDREQVGTILHRLAREGKVREKSHPTGPTIWVREPPTDACPECDREFEVRFHRPVLSSVQFCPRCGTEL
jgi:hypothetical protein